MKQLSKKLQVLTASFAGGNHAKPNVCLDNNCFAQVSSKEEESRRSRKFISQLANQQVDNSD